MVYMTGVIVGVQYLYLSGLLLTDLSLCRGIFILLYPFPAPSRYVRVCGVKVSGGICFGTCLFWTVLNRSLTSFGASQAYIVSLAWYVNHACTGDRVHNKFIRSYERRFNREVMILGAPCHLSPKSFVGCLPIMSDIIFWRREMKRIIRDEKYNELLARSKSGTYTTTEWTVLDAMQESTGNSNLNKDNYIVVENAYVSLILHFDGKQLIECVRDLGE